MARRGSGRSRRRAGRGGSALRLGGVGLALGLALAACTSEPPPRSRESLARLNDLVEPPRSGGQPGSCAIDDEFRPALGCPASTFLLEVKLADGSTGGGAIDVAVPDELRGRAAIVVPRLRAGNSEAWHVLAPAWSSALPERVHIDVPAAPVARRGEKGGGGVQLEVLPAPDAEQSYATPPIDVPDGALLSIALGLEPFSAAVARSPIEFRVVAHTAAGDVEVLRETLDPIRERASGARWHERRVALDAIAGRSASFALSTRAVAADEPPAVPLWGAPQLLAPRAADRRRNMLLISLDTLRGDHVGGEIAGERLTPFLDELARDATTFASASTAYPSTTASHMSLLTGVYPARHQVGLARHTLEPQVATLAEVLAAHGYSTGAVTENGLVMARAGFQRGFDSYREIKGMSRWDTPGEIDATFADGVAWIEQHRDERFFLFLHTYEVHSPYTPAPAYDLFRSWMKDGKRVAIDHRTPWVIAQKHLYAGEVRYVDAALRRLFGELDRLGVLDDTIVVITSDHGEEFKEHGAYGHGWTVYEGVIHVPLLVRAPGLAPAGVRVDAAVSLVDVAPTLLDLNAIAAPAGTQGRSLAPLLRGEPFPSDRPVFALRVGKWGEKPLVAARVGDLKWIFEGDDPAPIAIYDLARDPGEQTSLVGGNLRDAGRELLAAYRTLAPAAAGSGVAISAPPDGAVAGSASVAAAPGLDVRTAAKLRALGYLD